MRLLPGAVFVVIVLMASSISSASAVGVPHPTSLPSRGGTLIPPTHVVQYVVLVHGYDPTTVPAWTVWTYGVDLEGQLVAAGYRVIVVSYYGEFTLAFSNGRVYGDPTFFGTTNTPIEKIGLELAKELQATIGYSFATVDLVGHSMGGLVVMYMMEHALLRGITIGNVVFLGSPLGGASSSAWSGFYNTTGYQMSEMWTGSTFLASLNASANQARANYPHAEWLAYAGEADPTWSTTYFQFHANDGLVAANEVSALGDNHFYAFPDLHIPTLDVYDPGHVSYFEDPAVAAEMRANFAGTY